MARPTKAQQNETVWAYYGINLRTFELETVYERRDGRLVNHDAQPPHHYPLPGRTAENEILIVWHVGHLISFAPRDMQSEWVQAEIKALKAKADQMKADKAAKGS
jgi:hypothetical protein